MLAPVDPSIRMRKKGEIASGESRIVASDFPGGGGWEINNEREKMEKQLKHDTMTGTLEKRARAPPKVTM
jgi:hypothetical protein